jgi:hypothetical protein
VYMAQTRHDRSTLWFYVDIQLKLVSAMFKSFVVGSKVKIYTNVIRGFLSGNTPSICFLLGRGADQSTTHERSAYGR